MKNENIKNSWDKINPDDDLKEKMLFNIKNQYENLYQKKGRNIMIKKVICIIAVIFVISSTTVFAAYHYLTAGEVADNLGDNKLAKEFNSENIDNYATETLGDYKVTMLGITLGKNISNFHVCSEEINPERTYAAVAVEKTNGKAMTYDDEILVTPLIEGLEPWNYNIYTMNGSYMAEIIDGILYRIVEFDSIEYFADRHIYMAVLDNGFYDKDAYDYDNNTGLIKRNDNYKGTNILFDLNIDKSKADKNKARDYIEKINNNLN